MRLRVQFLSLLLAIAPSAGAVTLDFEGIGGSAFNAGESFIEDGLRVTSTGFFIIGTQNGGCSPVCGTNGTTTLDIPNNNVSAIFTPVVPGLTFDLLSLEAGEGIVNQIVGTVQLTGTLQGGGTVQTILTLDLVNDGPGGINDYQSFSTPATFVNLTRLEITGVNFANFGVDNLELGLNAVPEPSSFVLTVSAIAILGAFRRRRVQNKNRQPGGYSERDASAFGGSWWEDSVRTGSSGTQ
ncbi:MAG: PEP-CTERM sorting domain-containing protein [Bryobacteraceae bacterium]|nr:PEP-CTERM sorting domain-containing protein [Bryobacteraceae bacterium]